MNLTEIRAFFQKDLFATEVCGIEVDEITPTGAKLPSSGGAKSSRLPLCAKIQ